MHDRDRVVEISGIESEIPVVEVINIDNIPFEVDEGLFTLVPDMGGLIGVGGGSGEPADLGGDDQLFGAVAQDFGKHALRPAVAVNVGVIKMVHALVQGEVDGPFNLLRVHVGPTIGASIHPIQAS